LAGGQEKKKTKEEEEKKLKPKEGNPPIFWGECGAVAREGLATPAQQNPLGRV